MNHQFLPNILREGKIMKDNTNYKRVIAACEYITQRNNLSGINHLVSGSEVKQFTKDLKAHFNIPLFEKLCEEKLAKRRELCVHDVYKIMNRSNYFSVENARNKLALFKEEGIRIHHISPWSLAHKLVNAKFLVHQLNTHPRKFLATGARLCVGSYRQMPFKNNMHAVHFYTAKPTGETELIIEMAPNSHLALYMRQLRAALENIKEVIDVRQEQRFLIVQVKPTEPKQIPRKETVDKSTFIPVQSPHKMIEDHYADEMEKSINEITLTIDKNSETIFQLSNTIDRLINQRGLLLDAIKALRK